MSNHQFQTEPLIVALQRHMSGPKCCTFEFCSLIIIKTHQFESLPAKYVIILYKCAHVHDKDIIHIFYRENRTKSILKIINACAIFTVDL